MTATRQLDEMLLVLAVPWHAQVLSLACSAVDTAYELGTATTIDRTLLAAKRPTRQWRVLLGTCYQAGRKGHGT